MDAFGVRGQLKVRAFTEEPENLFEYPRWILQYRGRRKQTFEVLSTHLQGNYIVATLNGLATRDEALELKGFDILVPYSSLPSLPAGTYYWNDLVGLTVTNVDGMNFGKIVEIIETGANDILKVRGEKDHLIPYLDSVIKEVDLNLGTMRVDWFEDY